MADGSLHPRRKGQKASETEGLPLDPIIASLSAELGRALARIYFERQQAAEQKEKAA